MAAMCWRIGYWKIQPVLSFGIGLPVQFESDMATRGHAGLSMVHVANLQLIRRNILVLLDSSESVIFRRLISYKSVHGAFITLPR
jgi:hypothetical protein